jgi:hypothetical protein
MSDVEQPSLPAHANRARATVGWGSDGQPVRREDVENRPRSAVAMPGVGLMGPRSGDVAGGEPVDDTPTPDDEVPDNAHDVVAWIKDAGDDVEATRRAGQAWRRETQREGGVRATVEAEVDNWLEVSDG